MRRNVYFNHSPAHHDAEHAGGGGGRAGGGGGGRVSVHLVLTGRRGVRKGSRVISEWPQGEVWLEQESRALWVLTAWHQGLGKGGLPGGSDVQAETCETGRR